MKISSIPHTSDHFKGIISHQLKPNFFKKLNFEVFAAPLFTGSKINKYAAVKYLAS